MFSKLFLVKSKYLSLYKYNNIIKSNPSRDLKNGISELLHYAFTPAINKVDVILERTLTLMRILT